MCFWSGRSTTAPKKSLLVVTTPTTHDEQSQSDVISEVLDHTPSESVPEEVSDEATPTVTQLATEYSSDTFEPPDPTLPSSQSHPLPVTSTPAPLTAGLPLDLTGGGSGKPLAVVLDQTSQPLCHSLQSPC